MSAPTAAAEPTIAGKQSLEDVLADIESHKGAIQRAEAMLAQAAAAVQHAGAQRDALRASLERLQGDVAEYASAAELRAKRASEGRKP